MTWNHDITAAPRGEENTVSDWIEHDGKDMPVDGSVLVTVRFRDGDEDSSPINARFWHDINPEFSSWRHVGDKRCSAEIVAYRTHERSPEKGDAR